MTKGINRCNLLRIVPRGIRANLEHWRGELEVGDVIRTELAGGNRQAGVDAVRSGMSADGIALVVVANSANDRPTDQGIGMAPRDWNRIDAECLCGWRSVVNNGECENMHYIMDDQEDGPKEQLPGCNCGRTILPCTSHE